MEYGKKVLIIGTEASAYTLAKKLSNEVKVYVAPGSDAISEFANVVDIRENNVHELMEFVLENDISLTILTSRLPDVDIATVFQENNLPIFCPTKASAEICESKVSGKRFMYQNNILCPKSAVFDRPNLACSYLEKSTYPVVIKTDKHQKKGICVCNNIASAKSFIENIFSAGEKQILIENYIWGHEFSFYVITDGYQAIPIGCVATYKYELEGNGGLISSGMGAFSDNYKISKNLRQKIMDRIINPTINSLAEQQKPYVGILGLDLVVDDNDNIYAIEYNNFLKSPDAQVILELIDGNIYDLLHSCAIGAFADEYEEIRLKSENAVSCVLCSGEISSEIEGLENLDEETEVAHNNTMKKNEKYMTSGGQTLVLTRKSRILSTAVRDLYEEVDVIKFAGKRYRRDIGVIIQ